MNRAEYRRLVIALAQATACAARVQRKLAISEAVGWPDPTIAAELEEGKLRLRVARFELSASEARQRFEARYPH